jgi:hypothetical protein
MLTQIMRTHNQTHIVSESIIVKHFFCTSYAWDPAELVAQKRAECARRLAQLRG